MKTIYYTASSLDGFVADADNRLDWLLQFGSEPPGDFPAFLGGVGALAMGSTTYHWMLDNFVSPPGGDPQPWPYTPPTWVFSSRALPRVTGADIRFVQGDVRAVHEAMRAAAGARDLWIVGGGDLAGQFHDAGLLDEIVVTITSVTLGAGAPVLPRRITTPPLILRSATAHSPAFAELVYSVPRPPARHRTAR